MYIWCFSFQDWIHPHFSMPVMDKFIVKVATPINLGTEDAELNRLDQWKPKKSLQMLKTTKRFALLVTDEYLKVFFFIFKYVYFTIRQFHSITFFFIFAAERITAKCGWFHKYCFKCFDCNKLLDATNFFDGQ